MRNFIFISPHFPECFWKFTMALNNNGFNCLGIGDAPYNEISEQCKYSLNEYYMCPFMDNYNNEKRAVEYFKNKYGDIEFIESNNEFWLKKDALLRDEFNCHTSFSYDEVSFRMKKSNQKEFYIKAGLKPARYSLSRDFEELKKFALEVSYPIFAKPNEGVGAQGAFKIDNEIELYNFLLSLPSEKEYIFEEFIDGDIVSFDGITDSKGEIVFYTGHYFVTNTADVVKNKSDNMYYCYKEVPLDLVDCGKRAVKSFGLKRRFFHFEFFRLRKGCALGKINDIVPLEANFRVAGGYTPDLINYANSIDVYKIFADVMAYDENRQNLDTEKFFAVCSSRRVNFNYKYSFDEIINKYRNNITFYGNYPTILRDDLGDFFIMAKFKELEELNEFDNFVRKKEE